MFFAFLLPSFLFPKHQYRMRERAQASGIYLRQSRGQKNCFKERCRDLRIITWLLSPQCCAYIELICFFGSNYQSAIMTRERADSTSNSLDFYSWMKNEKNKTHADFPAVVYIWYIFFFWCLSCISLDFQSRIPVFFFHLSLYKATLREKIKYRFRLSRAAAD